MNNKLFVGNLSFNTNEADLRKVFGPAGSILSITIPMDRMSNQPRGFAFVEMSTPAEALNAIKLCNGQDLDGRNMKVDIAKPPEARTGGFSNGDRNSNGRRSDRR